MSPTEYTFLTSPLWSNGGDMIKSTLQELCLKNILTIEARWIYVDKRDTRQRLRFFLKLGENYNQMESYNKAESFVISAFKNKHELSFAQIRNFVTFHFKKDTNAFKRNFVYPDLKAKGVFWLPYLMKKKVRRERDFIKAQLENINTNIEVLIQNKTIGNELASLGLNVVLLKKEILKKIEEFDKDVLNIELLNFMNKNNSFNTLNSFAAIGSFDSLSSFDFASGSGGFDGFSGGDFGGGGAAGDW